LQTQLIFINNGLILEANMENPATLRSKILNPKDKAANKNLKGNKSVEKILKVCRNLKDENGFIHINSSAINS
jgi:hypothetical protein